VVKRLRGSAHGKRTWRTPSVGHFTRGGSGVEPGGESSGVEVAPGSLLGVVEHWQLGLARGAGPQPALVVRDGDVDAFVLDRKVDVLDEPGIGEPEDLGVELDVAHRCPWGPPQNCRLGQARCQRPAKVMSVSKRRFRGERPCLDRKVVAYRGLQDL
jgi:hypothetical protein